MSFFQFLIMTDFLDYNVQYGTANDKVKQKSSQVRVFLTRIDELSTKFIDYQDDLSAEFDEVLGQEPTKARLTEKITNESVRWSCVHETMEMLALAVSALAAIKASVSETRCKTTKASCAAWTKQQASSIRR